MCCLLATGRIVKELNSPRVRPHPCGQVVLSGDKGHTNANFPPVNTLPKNFPDNPRFATHWSLFSASDSAAIVV